MAKYNLIPSHFSEESDILTVNIKSKKLTTLQGFTRGVDAIESTQGKRSEWKFLAPMEINEDITNNWEEYESMATKLAQKTADISRQVAVAKGIGESVLKGTTDVAKGHTDVKGALRTAMSGANQNLVGLLDYRVDSPLVYKNSKRREYTLMFQLGVSDENTNEVNIFNAIRELEKLSCPELDGEMINIDFPAIFNIRTDPVPIIKINYAALTGVQPVWKGPYRNGYPMFVDLSLTFTDIQPLYRKSFEQGGIVRTE